MPRFNSPLKAQTYKPKSLMKMIRTFFILNKECEPKKGGPGAAGKSLKVTGPILGNNPSPDPTYAGISSTGTSPFKQCESTIIPNVKVIWSQISTIYTYRYGYKNIILPCKHTRR